MEFTTYLETGLALAVATLLADYRGSCEAESLSHMEQAIQGLSQTVGQALMAGWLKQQEPQYPPDTVVCVCGEKASYERRREAVTLTLQGRVTYRRAYYRCRCGRGCCPLDERLGIVAGQMSQRLVQVATLLGVTDAFGSSAAVLAQVTGVELSPNSIRAACQQTGEQVVAHDTALLAGSRDVSQQLAQRRTGPRPQRLYGSPDGFQGPFDDGWYEVKVGCWWTVNQANRTNWRRYYVDTALVAGL